ncbi:hypothetical protein RhiLY_07597 [Ceratobasidium sp. AG-Ba]|nr:hypothetical protein RhiLY_07597 [Ceratobasidium sp. AG-Ba]
MSLLIPDNYVKPNKIHDKNSHDFHSSSNPNAQNMPVSPTSNNPKSGESTTPRLLSEPPQFRADATPREPSPGFIEKSRPGYDDYGKELGKDARVWKTYVQEASRWDADLVDGWHRSLDLILIFAALFSAISTAFIVESIGDLQPDYSEVSSQTLSAISQTLLAIAKNQPGSPINVTIPEPEEFSAPASAIWVNALWFLSLSLSVAVSLISMLAKDWARSYVAELTGQPYQQARKRQRRWDGLREWKVPEVIQFLPSILHLSLLLFALGLTIYLWNLHIGAAIPVLIVTTLVIFIYAGLTILPLRDEHSPYSTPLSKLVVMLPQPHFSKWFRYIKSASTDYESILLEASRQEKDEDLSDDLTSRALSWLIINYEDTKSVDTALQAIAGSETRLPIKPLMDSGAFMLLERRLQNCFTARRGTGKLYLKDTDLLESALLYSRALTIPGEYSSESVNFLRLVWPLPANLVERPREGNSIDYRKMFVSFSPNKIAFALASVAVGSKPVHDKTGTGLTKPLEPMHMTLTTCLLEAYLNDELTLDPSALVAALRAASHWSSFDPVDENVADHIDLMLVVSRLILTFERNGLTYLHGLVGVALMTFACSRRDYSHWPQAVSLSRQNNTTRRAVVARLYDLYPETAAKHSVSLITFGLIELLNNYASRLIMSELNSLIEVLQYYETRAPVIETYDLPKAAFGSDFRYITDSIAPLLKANDQGVYACSEALRAVYLTIPNSCFLMDCPHAALFVQLALENLRDASCDLLKQRCCDLLAMKAVTRLQNLADGTTSPASLHVALSMLDSEDERIVPYAMFAIWRFADTVLNWSHASQTVKIALLHPALEHEHLRRARPVNGIAMPQFTQDMGFIELWLPRLEDMAQRIPQYIRDSGIVYHFRTSIDGQKPPHALRDRLVALLQHMRDASEVLPPPWS